MARDSAANDDYGLPVHPPCPFCEGHETEMVSPFGSVLSVAAFWCRGCHSAFELVKWGQGAVEGESGQEGGGERPGAPED